MRRINFYFLITAHLLLSGLYSQSSYVWKNVQIVGGGFVTGIVFHPNVKDVCYCRTDMGGAYRRNPETKIWEPLLDWVSYEDRNLMGVESIALDPSDPDKVYLACGTYTQPDVPNGAVLRSTDKGKTFLRSDVPFKMGANENGRGNGERLAVDPNNPLILFLGTRNAGLWKSTDGAVTWKKVESFPDISETPPTGMQNADSIRFWQWMNKGCGINNIIFDATSTKNKISAIYVFVSLINRENIFRSFDGGISWHLIPNQPISLRPIQAKFDTDGILYITYGDTPGPSQMKNGAVWKYNTRNEIWTEITPDKPELGKREFGYAGISVDQQNPQTLIVSTYHRYEKPNEEIFRSTDGGNSWKPIFANGAKFDYSLAPYVKNTGIHWMFDIEIDPFNSEHAICTAGYGGHETFNLTNIDKDMPTKWDIMSTGIEETVALELLSPPQGAHLISAIGDYGGFVHRNLDIPAPEGNFLNPHFGNTNGIACAEKNPNIIVRVGKATNHNPGRHIGYSLDGGKTWQPTATVPTPDAKLGHIAVTADGKAWIWSPEPVFNFIDRSRKNLPVYVTFDKGNSWKECKDIPNNTRVVADKINPNKFYAIDLFGGKLFTSNDAGLTFNTRQLNLPGGLPAQSDKRGDWRGGQDRIYASPDAEGDLWIAACDGLYHTTDSNFNFKKIKDVTEIHAFGFGKGKEKSSSSALYLIGVVKGIRGIFCSDDIGQSWIRINDAWHQWGLLLHITGDPKKHGRVYIGTHGRGIIYGDPVE